MIKIIKLSLLLPLFLYAERANGQKYISDYNQVSFYSEAPMEKIEARSFKAKSVLDAESGEVVFTVPIKTFEFEKSMMQEHFNENYLESDKYPKAKFKGKIIGFQKKAGKQQVSAQGELEIHGVSRQVTVPGEIDFSSNEIKIRATFPVSVADYKIKIPKMVASKIAEVVDVTIDFTYVSYEKQ